jgi:hypothetical protein
MNSEGILRFEILEATPKMYGWFEMATEIEKQLKGDTRRSCRDLIFRDVKRENNPCPDKYYLGITFTIFIHCFPERVRQAHHFAWPSPQKWLDSRLSQISLMFPNSNCLCKGLRWKVVKNYK